MRVSPLEQDVLRDVLPEIFFLTCLKKNHLLGVLLVFELIKTHKTRWHSPMTQAYVIYCLRKNINMAKKRNKEEVNWKNANLPATLW